MANTQGSDSQSAQPAQAPFPNAYQVIGTDIWQLCRLNSLAKLTELKALQKLARENDDMSMVTGTKDSMTSRPRPSRAKAVWRIVLAYVVISVTWIIVSNGLIGVSTSAPGDSAIWHTVRDLIFVVLTSALLLLLVTRLSRQLATTDEQFINVAEQARDVLVICDNTLHIAYANPAFQTLTGYSAAELDDMHVVNLVPAENVARLEAHIEALQTTAFLRQPWVVVGKTGRRCNLEVTSQRLGDGRYLAIGTEIDETQLAKKAAELERQRLNVLLRSIPDPVWLKDASGVYLACNPALEKLLGLPAGQIIGKASRELLPPEMLGSYAAEDRGIAETKQQVTCCQSYPQPGRWHRLLRHHPVSGS
jgi:PAS domain S-box-containing protein